MARDVTYINKRTLELFSEYLSVSIVIFGFLFLIGGIFDIEILKSFSPTFSPISTLTSLSFILIGTSLWLLQNRMLNLFNIWIAISIDSYSSINKFFNSWRIYI